MGFSIKGVGTALKGAGIGLVIALLVKLGEAFSQNQVIMDKVNTIVETMNITFQKFANSVINAFKNPQEVIKDFGNLLKTWVVDYINGLIESVGLFGKAIGKVFKGEFSEAVELAKEGGKTLWDTNPVIRANKAVIDYNKSIGETVKESNKMAKSLIALRKEVKLAEAEQRKLQLTYEKEAEIQRQVRDDISLTIDERIEANNKLGRILQEQFKEEEKLALKRIELAELELSKNTTNVDLQVALTNAQTEYADLQERIVGQTSEQKVNEVALNDERIANMQELSSIGKSELDIQLNDIQIQAEQKRELAKRTIADEQELANMLIKIDEEAKNEKQKILDEKKKMDDAEIAEKLKTKNEELKKLELALLDERELELSASKDKYKELIALAEKYGQDTSLLIEQFNEEQQDIQDKHDKIALEKKKKLEDEKWELQMKAVDTGQEILGALASIAQENLVAEKNALQEQLDAGLISQKEFDEGIEEIEKEALEREKKNAKLQIMIDTAQAIAGAIKGAMTLPPPASYFAIAAGITAVLSGIAQAKAIMNKVPGGSDGDGDESISPSTVVSGTSLIPNMETVSQPTLGDQPIQAYVVENDISNAQALQEELELQSSL